MTTLQEAIDKCESVAIESGAHESYKACRDAFEALRTALAQQGEPVAQARLGMKDGLAMALSVVELYGMKGDMIYREIAKLRDGIAAAPAPQPAQGEPVYQYQMADGSWIDQIKDSYDYNRKYAPNATVRVVYTAAPAPQPAQGCQHE